MRISDWSSDVCSSDLPHYKSPTVWLKDASRAVGVAPTLISKELRDAFVVANDADYAEIRERHRNRGDAKRLVSREKARAQRCEGGWDASAPPETEQTRIPSSTAYPQQYTHEQNNGV